MISPQVTHPLRQLLLGGGRGGVRGGRTPVVRTPAAQQNKIYLRNSFDRSLSRTLSRTQTLYTNTCTDMHTSSLCRSSFDRCTSVFTMCVSLSHELSSRTQDLHTNMYTDTHTLHYAQLIRQVSLTNSLTKSLTN